MPRSAGRRKGVQGSPVLHCGMTIVALGPPRRWLQRVEERLAGVESYDSETAFTAQDVRITRTEAYDHRVYNVKAYGAVLDGTTNDTAAWLAACAAAELTGGIVYIPPGKMKITQGYNFTTGLNGTNKAVVVQGAGDHNTQILFYPSVLSDNCISFGDGTHYYFGGGVRDLQINNVPNTCTGAGIYLYVTIHTTLQSVYSIGFQGTGGAGIRARQNGAQNIQHLSMINCYWQQNYFGADLESGGACQAFNMKINQNTYQGLRLLLGDLLWCGGVLQGASAQPAAKLGDAILALGQTGNITVLGVYVEYATADIIWDVESCNYVRFINCAWQNAATVQAWVHAVNSGDIVIEDQHITGANYLLTGSGSSGRVFGGTVAQFNIHAATSNFDFIGAGALPSAYRTGVPPVQNDAALVLGGGVQLKSYTTTQLNALTNVQQFTLAGNSTTSKVVCYIGAAWVDLN